MVKMATTFFPDFHEDTSLKGTQLLLSQILHDLISPFSALSAGMDLLSNHQGKNNDLIGLIQVSKDQLCVRLALFRSLFGYTKSGLDNETYPLLKDYLKEMKIVLPLTIPSDISPKIIANCCFWLTKQAISKGGSLEFQAQGPYRLDISLVTTDIRENSSEDPVLLGHELPASPQTSYAYYLWGLLRQSALQANLQRSRQRLTLSLTTQS